MPDASRSGASGPPPELVRQELNAILASDTLRNASRLSALLRYLVEEALRGNADKLKEYQIGIDVFERKSDYDTRTDPVVRVQARQLRFKLGEYYAQFGASDRVIISLPKGGYAAQFDWAGGQPRDEPQAAVRPRSTSKLITFAVAVGLVIILGITLLARRGSPSRLSTVAAQANSAEARELCLKGRYYWSKRTPDALNQAVDLFTQALVKDPEYVPAYVGLADTYNLLSEYTAMPQADAFSRALSAARRAVQLDDRSVEAHTSLAFALFWGAWDPAAAEREYRRAIELNPNYVTAHHWYATMLSGLGRSAEAIREIERARELDPSSTSIIADEGNILLVAGKREQARGVLKQLASSDPPFISTHRYLATLYLSDGEFQPYLNELSKCASLTRDQEQLDIVSAGEKAFAAGGPRAMLEAMRGVEERYASPQRPRNYQFAVICALLGDKNKALDYLHAAVENRESDVLVMSCSPELNSLHDDPRWKSLLKQVHAALL